MAAIAAAFAALGGFSGLAKLITAMMGPADPPSGACTSAMHGEDTIREPASAQIERALDVRSGAQCARASVIVGDHVP